MLHFLSTYLLHPLTGNGYQWWSGAGSDIAEVTILGVVLRHVNCNEPGCWRFGYRHPGHGQPVCRKHYHSHKEPFDAKPTKREMTP